MNLENLYIVGFGLGGGFGGINTYEVVEAKNEQMAEKDAYWRAREEYENYGGMYGLESEETLMEELGIEDPEDEELKIAYTEAIESWIEYSVEPWSRELEEKYKMHHYENSYKDITDGIG